MRLGLTLLTVLVLAGCFEAAPEAVGPSVHESESALPIDVEVENGTKRYEIRSSRLGLADSLANFQLDVPQGGTVRLMIDLAVPGYSDDPGCVAWSYEVSGETQEPEDPGVRSSSRGAGRGRDDAAAAAYFAYRITLEHAQVQVAGQSVTGPTALGGGNGRPRAFAEERSWEFGPGTRMNFSLGSAAQEGSELPGGLAVATVEVDGDATLTRLDDAGLRCGVGLADAAATAGVTTTFPQAVVGWRWELATLNATTAAFSDQAALLTNGRVILPEATTEFQGGLANGVLVEIKQAARSSGTAAIELDQAVMVTAAGPLWLLADAYWPALSLVGPFE